MTGVQKLKKNIRAT